jgi:predicted MPP superfamily phosphohydrolase
LTPASFRKTPLAALLCAAALSLSAQDPVTFLHISDTHVSNYTGAHPKLREWRDRNGETVGLLKSFLATTVPEQRPSFVIASGDLIDAYCLDGASGSPVYGQIELFRSIVEKSPVPFYPGMGNHDIECYRYQQGATAAVGDQSVKAETRQAWRKQFDVLREGTYYSFRKQVGKTVYLFLILDDGENGKSIDLQYREAQMTWVKREMESHPDDPVIFTMHIPLGKNTFTDALRTAAANGRPVLALAGHNHRDVLDEVPFGERPLQQVRTAALEKGAGNWRAIRLFADHIEVTETGNPTRMLLNVRLPDTRH